MTRQKLTYAEKLKDPRWQKKRLEILERDDFICQICGDEESTLHIHHLTYHKNKDPWEYNSDCFVTLCKACHENEKTDFKLEKDFVDSFKKKFISYSNMVSILHTLKHIELPHIPEVFISALCDFLSDKKETEKLIKNYFRKLKKRRNLKYRHNNAKKPTNKS